MPIKKYKCFWCEHNFQINVEYLTGSSGGRMSRHKGCFSTQVKCPKCRRFIPTWNKEETKNSVGRKHIHPGR